MASPLPNKKWLVALLSHVGCPLIRKSQEPLEQASQESKNEKALEDWDQKLVSKSVFWSCAFSYRFEKAPFFATTKLWQIFLRIRLGHRLQLLTAPRQSYKLTPSQRPPLAVGSLASSDIILGHSVDFKKLSCARSIHQKRASRLGIQSNKTKK